MRVLAAQPPGAFVSLPRYAPDGQRIVATVFDGVSFSIRVFDAHTGGRAGPGHRRARGRARRRLGRRHARRLPALGRERQWISGLPGRSRQRTVASGHPRPLPGVRATGGRRHAAVPQPRRLALDARRASGEPRADPGAARCRAVAGLGRHWPVWPLAGRRQPFRGSERRRLRTDRSSVRPADARRRFRHRWTSGDVGRGEPRRRRPAAVPSLGAERALAAGRRSPRLRRLRRLREPAVRAVLHRRRARWRCATTTPCRSLRRR